MLDTARGMAGRRRIDPTTFSFCSHRGLGGRYDRAHVETRRAKQPDGSDTWLRVDCHRKHGTWKWPCWGTELRGFRVAGGDVELDSPSGEAPIDAALARDLVERASEVAARPPDDLQDCSQLDRRGPMYPSRSTYDAIGVTKRNERYAVLRGFTIVEFDVDAAATPSIALRCRAPAVVVVE
jgi:hypothetical protein